MASANAALRLTRAIASPRLLAYSTTSLYQQPKTRDRSPKLLDGSSISITYTTIRHKSTVNSNSEHTLFHVHHFVRRSYFSPSSRHLSSTASSIRTPPAQTRGSSDGLLRLSAIGLSLAVVGFLITAGTSLEALGTIIKPVTDEESLKPCETSGSAQEIENTINAHPIVLRLRQSPDFIESRPHLKIPPHFRDHNLTGGTLIGPGKVEVPPYAWSEKGGRSFVSIAYLGTDLCGHPGIVHGGFLATMLDEGLARCCFPALPHNVGMTANLNINYRTPAQAGSFVVLRATTTKVDGRKAWVEGRLETLPIDGETPVVIADATGLFISPRHAVTMKRAYPVS